MPGVWRLSAHSLLVQSRGLYKGEPTGTPAADYTRLILELAERVSNFR